MSHLFGPKPAGCQGIFAPCLDNDNNTITSLTFTRFSAGIDIYGQQVMASAATITVIGELEPGGGSYNFNDHGVAVTVKYTLFLTQIAGLREGDRTTVDEDRLEIFNIDRYADSVEVQLRQVGR